MSVWRPSARLARDLPWQWRAVIGAAAAVLGCYLVTSPLSSLTTLAVYLGATFLVLGVTELARPGRGTLGVLVGVAWSVLGVVVLVSPGHLVSALPTLIAIYLLVAGVLRMVGVRHGTIDERASACLLGLTQIVLAVLALTLPDVTLLAAAALFGFCLAAFGLSLAGQALTARGPARQSAPREHGPWRRWARVLAGVTALVVSLVLLAIGGGLKNGSPDVDSFYAAPAHVPATPGQLLRSEPFAAEVPPTARAWRILYTTTDALGRPTIASGIVLVPRAPARTPHPVIAWAHGTTGYARQCAPSLLAMPFTAGAFPDVMSQVVRRGWAVVATDYAGLGTAGPQPYIIGRGEARSVLDAVRAARALTAADLSTTKTVVWGHSQGGGAALWTDQEQPTYAPDVPLLGTVAMAPAANPLALARNLGNVSGGSVFGSFVATAYADTYPDVRFADFIRPSAVPFVRQLASRCLSEPGVLASVLTALSLRNEEILSTDPGAGALGRHLRANTPTDPGPGPLLIAQGLSDGLVVPSVTGAYVDQLRADGHAVTYRTYAGLDHVPLVQHGSALLPVLLAWTSARFSAAR